MWLFRNEDVVRVGRDDAGRSRRARRYAHRPAARPRTLRRPPRRSGSTPWAAWTRSPGRGAGAFGWDNAGRLTGTADGRPLGCDAAGQLASLHDPDANTTTTFAYDADGNRASQTTGATSTAMTWDVAGNLTGHTTATTSTS